MIDLQLQQLLPLPLKERAGLAQSEVWLRDLALKARSERVFIQAPSGTGKTTLIHILYGLRKDFEGTALWGGKAINSLDAEALSVLRQQELAVIFQDMRLFPALSAWENMEIKRVLTNTVSADEARHMMVRLGIADRADRPAHTLSYGEQQRLSIIRALLQPFHWLLMDEPFSHLDKANTAKATALIEEVATRNDASLILADLDDNVHFLYTQKLRL